MPEYVLTQVSPEYAIAARGAVEQARYTAGLEQPIWLRFFTDAAPLPPKTPTHLGFFLPEQPFLIFIRAGLSRAQVVSTARHEVRHVLDFWRGDLLAKSNDDAEADACAAAGEPPRPELDRAVREAGFTIDLEE